MKRPIIGITGGYAKYDSYSKGVFAHHDYHHSVLACNGVPLILPIVDAETLKAQIDLCDGIIFSGGMDIDPFFYNEEPHQQLGELYPDRDEFEIEAIRYALAQKKPLLAICRGLQIFNVALGGTLFQDIPSQVENTFNHSQKPPRKRPTHWVYLEGESRLKQIFETDKVRVNSLHHQAIHHVADSLVVVGKASDGIIEAVEYPNHPFAVAVQWHPESMTKECALMKKLFQTFVNVSGQTI